MSKCVANASFYRLKFRTIDLMTNCWVGGHLFDLVTTLIFLYEQKVIANIRIWKIFFMKVLGNCLCFPKNQEWAHLDFYNSRYGLNIEQCMSWRTDSDFSFLAIIWTWKQPFWILDYNESFRPMSYLSIHINQT